MNRSFQRYKKENLALVELESDYEVTVVTQNVDDLHERAGSKDVTHLHGELLKARSSIDEAYVIDIDRDIALGELCPDGSQLRPAIVWFVDSGTPRIEKTAFHYTDDHGTESIEIISILCKRHRLIA